jgi:16S rRNA (guanine1516-N2)-methyltransferase
MSRFVLVQDENGYGIKDVLIPQRPLRVDFLSSELHYRRVHGGKKELLLKAVKARPGVNVWDCTAGLGTDSFLMASIGCNVTLFERSTVIAMLLEQALLSSSGEVGQITSRMTLIKGDASIHLLGASDSLGAPDPPDVIYIDPMFPSRHKSAQVKGDMQILQRFIGKDEDANELVQLALQSGCARVVVKRPVSGGVLDGMEPAFSLAAKSNRFDVFLNSQSPA